MVFIYSLIFALSKTKKNMIQHNQVGKYKTKQSIIDAKIGSVFITPSNYEYELLRKEKVGKRWHYVYNWVNCPDEIKEKINNTPVSYTHLTLPTIHVECRSRWSPYH